MGKVLLTKNNIEQYIEKNQSELFMDQNMILTSGAKDVIRSRGISIIYDKKREGPLVEQIIKLLTKDYGITDAAELTNVCNLILERINKN